MLFDFFARNQQVLLRWLQKLIDKVYICITPEFFGDKQLDMFGKLDKIVKLKDVYIEKMDEDILIAGYVKKKKRKSHKRL